MKFLRVEPMLILRSWGFIKERPWALSLMLHGSLFLILCLTVLLSGWQCNPEVHVFTLVSDMPASSTNASIGAALLPIQQSETTNAKEFKLEKIIEKKVTESKDPKQVVQNIPKEIAKPTEVKATKLTAPDSSKLTYEEFMKQQSKVVKKVTSKEIKDAKPINKQTFSTSIPNPSSAFDISKIKDNLKKMVATTTISAVQPSTHLGVGSANVGNGTGVGGVNPAMLTALELYLSSLKANVDRAWQKPEKVSRQDLNAVVEFYIDAQGRISQHKLVKMSGDSDFDRSVLNAFETVGQSVSLAGLPPGNQVGWYRLTFHLN